VISDLTIDQLIKIKFKNLKVINIIMADGKNFMEDFISPYEAEHLIRSLKEIDIKEYGSKQ